MYHLGIEIEKLVTTRLRDLDFGKCVWKFVFAPIFVWRIGKINTKIVIKPYTTPSKPVTENFDLTLHKIPDSVSYFD